MTSQHYVILGNKKRDNRGGGKKSIENFVTSFMNALVYRFPSLFVGVKYLIKLEPLIPKIG